MISFFNKSPRFTGLFLIFLVGTAGVIYAYQLKTGKGFFDIWSPPLQDESDQQVLGEMSAIDHEQSSGASSVLSSVQSTLNPLLSSISEHVQTVYDSAISYVNKDQKIEVEKVFEQTKEQLQNIPEEVFEKAQYEYCHQVVEEYEQK